MADEPKAAKKPTEYQVFPAAEPLATIEATSAKRALDVLADAGTIGTGNYMVVPTTNATLLRRSKKVVTDYETEELDFSDISATEARSVGEAVALAEELAS